MALSLSRRAFVVGPCVLAAAGMVKGAPPEGGDGAARRSAWPGFPYQDPASVREFVGACHGNLEKVRAMLGEHPALAKCAWDWGYGDWESALGAAAHTGRREIARLLIEHGARLDLFGAAMLGMTDVVKAMVAAQPGIEATPGPHGIMLLGHARAGGDEAMLAYVQTLPGSTAATPRRLTDEEAAPLVGTYTADDGAPVEVAVTRLGLAVKVGGGADRVLTPTGTNQFHPAGAPNVRITFTVTQGKGRRIEFVEGAWFAQAARE